MEYSEFEYTKANGKVSNRSVVVLSKPSKNVFGIDVSELSPESFGEFMSKIRDIEAAKKLAMSNLMAEFDLTNNFRQFIPENMTNVETQDIGN